MPAPMKSLRPKKRPNRRLGPDDEGSTQHPSGKNMDQRTQGKGAGTRHPSGKNIYEQDTQTFMDGGMVKQGYMDGGMVKQGYMDGGEVVRRGDVRDNPKRGTCY